MIVSYLGPVNEASLVFAVLANPGEYDWRGKLLVRGIFCVFDGAVSIASEEMERTHR